MKRLPGQLNIMAVAFAAALPLFATAEVKVNKYFGSYMVLQREKPVTIWGTADTGEAVQVTLADKKLATSADKNGNWSVTFPPLKASYQPIEFQVNDQRFDDVLVGDVWLNSGQSNMSWALSKVKDADQPKITKNPKLRLRRMVHLRNVARDGYTKEELANSNVNDYFQGQWKTSSQESAQEFSAVAWVMGNQLTEAVNAPIGMVQVSVGGSAINNWLPPEAIKASPLISHLYTSDWLNNDKVKPEHRQRARDAFQHVLTEGQAYIPGDFPYRWTCEPGFLFEAGIEPLAKVAFKGITWYQGEADSNTPEAIQQYRELLPLLINTWRAHLQDSTLPFLAVQLPSFGRGSWPALREVQKQAVASVENAALVVTVDTGDKNNIHPSDKVPVGKRMAVMALRTAYGENNQPQYPTIEKVVTDKDSLSIHLGNYALGKPGTAVAGFELGDNSGEFFPAPAAFTGKNTIELQSPVTGVTSLRYGWLPYLKETVLVNKANMPLPPQQLSLDNPQ